MTIYIIWWDNGMNYEDHDHGIESIYLDKALADAKCDELNKNGFVDAWLSYSYLVKEYNTED